MEVRDFYEWMRDVRTGEFYKVIVSEKQAGEQYPKEYKIQSVENGASNRFKPANAKEESGSEKVNYSDESKNVTEKNKS